MKKRRILLFILIGLLLILGLPMGLLFREYRREQTNEALISAIKAHSPAKALAALKEGADPNASDSSDGTPLTFLQSGANPMAPETPPSPPPLLSRDLLNKAARITGTEGWSLPNGTDAQAYMTYYWPSNDRVLYFADEEQIGELLCEFNVATGTRTQFRTVSKLWSEDGWFKKQIEISPDGQWILWDGDFHDHDYHGYYGARRDGSQQFHIPHAAGFKWMPDSRHFIEYVYPYADPSSPATSPYSRIRSVETLSASRKLSAKQAALYTRWTTHLLSENRVMQVKEFPERDWPPTRYVLEEIRMEPEPKSVRRWTILAPQLQQRQAMQISPDGRQIAWLIVTPQDCHTPQTVALSVSRIEGSAMREIGHLTLPAAPSDWEGPTFERYPHEMKWLPDGKRVSFIFQDALYTVLAE